MIFYFFKRSVSISNEDLLLLLFYFKLSLSLYSWKTTWKHCCSVYLLFYIKHYIWFHIFCISLRWLVVLSVGFQQDDTKNSFYTQHFSTTLGRRFGSWTRINPFTFGADPDKCTNPDVRNGSWWNKSGVFTWLLCLSENVYFYLKIQIKIQILQISLYFMWCVSARIRVCRIIFSYYSSRIKTQQEERKEEWWRDWTKKREEEQ